MPLKKKKVLKKKITKPATEEKVEEEEVVAETPEEVVEEETVEENELEEVLEEEFDEDLEEIEVGVEKTRRDQITRVELIKTIQRGLAEEGLRFGSKEILEKVINVIEGTLVDVIDEHNVNFMGGYFKMREVNGRTYNPPMSEHPVFVPNHKKITFTRDIGKETYQGKIEGDTFVTLDGEEMELPK